jgi:hypothetical protein
MTAVRKLMVLAEKNFVHQQIHLEIPCLHKNILQELYLIVLSTFKKPSCLIVECIEFKHMVLQTSLRDLLPDEKKLTTTVKHFLDRVLKAVLLNTVLVQVIQSSVSTNDLKLLIKNIASNDDLAKCIRIAVCYTFLHTLMLETIIFEQKSDNSILQRLTNITTYRLNKGIPSDMFSMLKSMAVLNDIGVLANGKSLKNSHDYFEKKDFGDKIPFHIYTAVLQDEMDGNPYNSLVGRVLIDQYKLDTHTVEWGDTGINWLNTSKEWSDMYVSWNLTFCASRALIDIAHMLNPMILGLYSGVERVPDKNPGSANLDIAGLFVWTRAVGLLLHFSCYRSIHLPIDISIPKHIVSKMSQANAKLAGVNTCSLKPLLSIVKDVSSFFETI